MTGLNLSLLLNPAVGSEVQMWANVDLSRADEVLIGGLESSCAEAAAKTKALGKVAFSSMESAIRENKQASIRIRQSTI